jgi:hypothetical protein
MALLRAALLRLVSGGHLDVVVLQAFGPWRAALRLLGSTNHYVVATPEQYDAISRLADEVAYLHPRISPARVSAADPDAVRLAYRLPAGRIYLHVGHARVDRNLGALKPLTSSGHLVVVVSPYQPDEDGALPDGPGVTILRGAIENMGDLYRAADVYVFPTFQASSMIGTPLSVFEALANGLPVVARASQALQRWSDLPGLHLCDSDEDLVSVATSAGGRGSFVSPVGSAEACFGDLSCCHGEPGMVS